MKRIYAFTLDSEEYPSSKSRFRFDLRLMAYLMHDLIYNYDGEGYTALIINDTIKNNNIREGSQRGEYYLDYNEYNEKYINYEPFIIGTYSFALTIDDEVMGEDVLYELMEQVLILINKQYKYRISSVSYESKNINDEKNRKRAVQQLCWLLDGSKVRQNLDVKKRVLINPLIRKKIGLF